MIDLNILGSGLIIASVTGLTYLAYKHPAAYERIFLWIIAAMTLFLIAAFIWDTSRSQAYIDMLPFISSGKDFESASESRNAARKAMDDGQILDATIFILYFGFNLYLLFLAILPVILGKNKQEQK